MSDAVSILGLEAKSKKPAERRPFSRGFVYTVLGILVLFLLGVAGPIDGGPRHTKHNDAMQQGRQIGQVMFAYAEDHNGVYPDGKSSTEVFQKLLDGNYVTDPAIFYVPLPGKVKAVAGQKLKPENVCWDVTSGVNSRSSDLVPLVFMTGYRITYVPGSPAVPIINPYPPFWRESRTWSQWWDGAPVPDSGPSGMAIFYQDNSAWFKKLEIAPNGDGSIPNFIPLDFKPDSKTYRQLTPDGPLP